MSGSARLGFHVVWGGKPEGVEEGVREVAAIAEAMSKEDTFLSCDLHRDANDPNVFTLYERWAEPDVETFLARQDKPYRREYETKLPRSEEHTSELQSLMRISYAVFCLKKTKTHKQKNNNKQT